MKFDNQNNKLDTEIVSKIQQQKEKETVFFGTILVDKGHKVFQINLETKEVQEADYLILDKTIHWHNAIKKDFSSYNKKVLTKEGYVYIPALNAKNALKRFERDPRQSSYFKPKPLMNINLF